MLFLEYEILKQKYLDAQEQYEEILNEKEVLFARTQPNGVRYDKEKVSGGSHGDPFADYLTEKERRRIDERLAEAKTLVDERLEIMKRKEHELRLSDGLYDTVYRCRYIDRSHVKKIAKIIGYSRSQTYRVIERIDETIKLGRDATKCEKNGAIMTSY